MDAAASQSSETLNILRYGTERYRYLSAGVQVLAVATDAACKRKGHPVVQASDSLWGDLDRYSIAQKECSMDPNRVWDLEGRIESNEARPIPKSQPSTFPLDVPVVTDVLNKSAAGSKNRIVVLIQQLKVKERRSIAKLKTQQWNIVDNKSEECIGCSCADPVGITEIHFAGVPRIMHLVWR
ncbi:MAG: hypothetical protein R3B57_01480 [Phycisphaerales bacterium]